MALPGTLTTKTVVHTLLDVEGAPMRGTVSIEPSIPVRDATGNVVLAKRPVTKTLDAAGSATFVLPVNDDADLLDTGWTYAVTEAVRSRSEPSSRFGAQPVVARTWSFALVAADAATVYLADKIPAVPVIPTATYAQQADITAAVSTSETTARATYLSIAPGAGLTEGATKAELDAATAQEGFRAYRGANQPIAAATSTTVVFDVEVRDQGADYDPATGQWTVPTTGWYDVATGLLCSGLAAGQGLAADLYVGAAENTRLFDFSAAAAGTYGPSGAAPLYLTAGNVVTIRVYSPAAFTVATGAAFTWFTGKRR